jgi:predicted ATPase
MSEGRSPVVSSSSNWLTSRTSRCCHTVIATLGIHEQSSGAPMTVLSAYLRHRQLLLILDNCEHLLEACAELADVLLRAAPDLRIIATSQHSLRTSGEHVHQVRGR